MSPPPDQTRSAGGFALLLVALGFGGFAAAPAAEPPRVTLHWNTNSSSVTVEVAGVGKDTLVRLQATNSANMDWSKLLSVYAGAGVSQTDPGIPAMLGSYGVVGDRIRFQPRFPLDRGVPYRAVFRPSKLPGSGDGPAPDVVTEFLLPALARESTTSVVQVYPTANVLPENLLKFYVHFSAPMRGGQVYEHIRLRDEAGRPVELPFLELDEELWNPEMTRLTLFIDPGRIKREVKPLEDIGPALETGKRYTLEIEAALPDHTGAPLRGNFRKLFRVSAPDREAVSLANWKLDPPKPGTLQDLVLHFPEPMDHALALRVIRVANAAGRQLEGRSTVADHETRWVFTPQEHWTAGAYHLQVQNTIEDLAGNNPGKAFEEDLSQGTQRRFTNQVLRLSFEVR